MVRRDDQGRRLCTATTRKGEPCRAAANIGATVCRMHGASAPQVKAKAARVLLEELVGPALVHMKTLLDDSKTPAAVRLGAIRDILDRTGFKPVVQVQGVPTVAAVEAWLEEIEAENP